MGRRLLLGVDVSTTGAKALLIDQDGQVVFSATTPLTMQTPPPLWSEQDPRQWWKGIKKSIRQVIAEEGISAESISAVGLMGKMHGLVMLNKSGELLRPAILWNDQRTGSQCDQIRTRIGLERLIQITGNDALTGFIALKILWVQEDELDICARAYHKLLHKDYICYQLTGQFAMDRAGGSGTILFNLQERFWSDELLTAFDIPAEWFLPTFEGPQITGQVTAQADSETGLAGTPVVGGAGDQAAQAVGVGVVKPGMIALTLGTSGIVFTPTESALIEAQGRLHAFCHAMPERWHFMGVMLSTVGSLQWHRDTIAPDLSFYELVDEALEISPGNEGLLFLPYLMGERPPYPDPLTWGALVGLTVRHHWAHLTRAILEGVAFWLKEDSFRLIQEAGLGAVDQVCISGGGAKSQLWKQILVDVLDVELVTVNTAEGAAFGATLLAGFGAGIFANDSEACEGAVQLMGSTSPSSAVKAYQDYYPQYRSLYPALADQFKAIAIVTSADRTGSEAG